MMTTPDGYGVRPMRDGGARVHHQESGEVVECNDHPVFTLNMDAAIRILEERITRP